MLVVVGVSGGCVMLCAVMVFLALKDAHDAEYGFGRHADFKWISVLEAMHGLNREEPIADHVEPEHLPMSPSTEMPA
jgi:hypothetical protein